jgi:hypothetical protein
VEWRGAERSVVEWSEWSGVGQERQNRKDKAERML